MLLDKQQSKIVKSKEKNIVVSAGAGSGKTRILTERIRNLIATGTEPHNIVAITFTNMAAEEMRARLSDIPTIGDAFVGTIHSFANRIYKVSEEPYVILTEEIEMQIMKEVLGNKKYEDLSFSRWLAYIEVMRLRDLGRTSDRDVSEFLTTQEKEVLRDCINDYEKIRKRHNAITFDELLQYATKYYKSTGATIEHVLVDELQDIGFLEYDFITKLKAENYFYIGDDWQAIYGWKGGNVNIFNGLLTDKKFVVYQLENNYRNSSEIISTATRVLTTVMNKSNRKVIGMNKNKGIVQQKSKDKINDMLQLIKRDTNTGNWFVLARTNQELNWLSELLSKSKIEHIIIRKSELTLEELEKTMSSTAVKLLTVHSAKGLESERVILYGSFPINAPNYRTKREEKLVAYVGVTRAINELYIFN